MSPLPAAQSCSAHHNVGVSSMYSCWRGGRRGMFARTTGAQDKDLEVRTLAAEEPGLRRRCRGAGPEMIQIMQERGVSQAAALVTGRNTRYIALLRACMTCVACRPGLRRNGTLWTATAPVSGGVKSAQQHARGCWLVLPSRSVTWQRAPKEKAVLLCMACGRSPSHKLTQPGVTGARGAIPAGAGARTDVGELMHVC